MANNSNYDAYPQYARDATSYVLVAKPQNTSRQGSKRHARWETIVKYSGHADGVALAQQEGQVSKRHLYTLERQGQLLLNTSPSQVDSQSVQAQDDESRFPEGAAAYAIHRTLERDPGLAQRAKKRRLAQTGALVCDACGFDFERTYGVLGRGFIEAHHTQPVATLAGERKTALDELALVCSNCHRMLHTGEQLLSVDALKRLIQKAG